jgi:hypothetical protein
MKPKETPDYWEMSPSSQSAILGEFSKTTSGVLISLIGFRWTRVEKQELSSFRIYPVASLRVVAPQNSGDADLLKLAKNFAKTLQPLINENNQSLPLEELENFDLKSRLSAWLELRKNATASDKKEIESLGINKATTVDYLNLQSLGIKDYQKILAELYDAKPLTIRDRIAYARRHKWIEQVGHGDRTSQMSRITK